ncbi:hypothetical protein [Paracoccus ravus]|uniref:hypothetical protein n=1 Tax=Paracoccus ravus TaxID=2447760 RepID=UPI00106E1B62|nr:hypothetical protein [Paracoccus ravus]
MTTDSFAAVLAELDSVWLRITNHRPFVRPLLRHEIEATETALPAGAEGLVLVRMGEDGTIHRHCAAVTSEALMECGMPSAKRLAALLEADAEAARARSLN